MNLKTKKQLLKILDAYNSFEMIMKNIPNPQSFIDILKEEIALEEDKKQNIIPFVISSHSEHKL